MRTAKKDWGMKDDQTKDRNIFNCAEFRFVLYNAGRHRDYKGREEYAGKTVHGWD